MEVNAYPRRGEIWLVNLNPVVGSEIRKTRPALVISNNINNEHAGTVTVLPITNRGEKVYPFEVTVAAGHAGLTKASKIKCQQIRIVDKSRLVKFFGSVEENLLPGIEEALWIHLGMNQRDVHFIAQREGEG